MNHLRLLSSHLPMSSGLSCKLSTGSNGIVEMTTSFKAVAKSLASENQVADFEKKSKRHQKQARIKKSIDAPTLAGKKQKKLLVSHLYATADYI
jgi:hypothetical protein